MTDLARSRFVQVGLHASTTDFSTLPGTFVALEPDDLGFDGFEVERVERDLYAGDNQEYAAIIGPDELNDISLGTPLRGVATNDGAAMTALTETDIGHILEAAFGAASSNPAGAATTVTGDTGASATVTVASGAGVANGDGILFMDGNSEYVAREIVSGGGTGTLVTDRNHVDGAPGSDAVLYRSIRNVLAPGTPEHKPLGIRVKATSFERTAVGCGCVDFMVDIKPKVPVLLRTKWRPTDVNDTNVGPTFTAPTAGDYVMGVNCKFYYSSAGEPLMLREATLTLGHTIVARETVTGPNGVKGYLITRKQPVLEGLAYIGANGITFGELQDSTGNMSINKIQGLTSSAGVALSAGQVASTYDVGMQIGAGPGRTLYVRIPAAELRGKIVKENGIEMLRFQALARRPAAGSALRWHMF